MLRGPADVLLCQVYIVHDALLSETGPVIQSPPKSPEPYIPSIQSL